MRTSRTSSRTCSRSLIEEKPFRVSQPAISRHLKVLEGAGLISRHRKATARLSHLEAEPLREATAWLARYREYWDESYLRLDALLTALEDDHTD